MRLLPPARQETAMRIAAPIAAVALVSSIPAIASDVVEVVPLTSQQLLVHFSDGYVIHHKHLQKRSDEKVVVDPLDVVKASNVEAYRVICTADSFYEKGVGPERIGRKSKG